MSDIVVTGATGAIGRRAVRRLVGAGHTVTGVIRPGRDPALLTGLGARAVEAEVFDDRSLGRAFAGADVVVNLLTSVPPVQRTMLRSAWDQNDHLRREASGAVARAAAAQGVDRLVQESLGYLYADGGDRWLDEDAPLHPEGPPAAALAAERNATRLFGGDTVLLRFAGLMAPDSDQTQAQLAQARIGLSSGFTPRGAYVPTVWTDDAAAAVVAALRAPAGAYNVVDDDPPTRAQSDAALAAAVGRGSLRAPLAPVARVLPLLRALSRSRRLSNARLRETTGWAPRVRSGVEGWQLARSG